jgi:hypothetical protein
MKSDYLKFWRVVRYYVKAKYGLSQADLEILLFLYSESYFSKDKFREFDKLVSWDENRFDNLLRDGWIGVFRIRKGRRKALYELTYKSKRVIDSVYKKLNGDEIPTDLSNNPLFYKNVKSTDKIYRNMILQMNEYVRKNNREKRMKNQTTTTTSLS